MLEGTGDNKDSNVVEKGRRDGGALQVTQGLAGTVRSLALSLSKMESIQVY